ncbi:HNH endonuclease signature motif containing protein [Microbacterium suwonense]|uniref:HNH nuclease domain-containing protein n=1 Tax=Microbacterium suwonense TaxID=683047 RepID=A0ABN6WXX4_9MICO|nr:HNH endonuclease signature motif containing protein [Microbacterium suwonense]BDZ37437.1 hypothetical protein GCM10025863_00510 [Microbacterium suwonense]
MRLAVQVAVQIAHESRAELGADSLSKQAGFRSPVQLIAATTGLSAGDAAGLVKVGEATAPRTDLVGQRMPAKYPAVQAALSSGALGAPAASLIVTFLDRACVGQEAGKVAEVEGRLVNRAQGLSLDDVRRLVKSAEAVLEESRLEAREHERRAQRSATMFERDGNLHLNLITPIEEGAAIKAAVDGYVTAQFQARKDASDAGEASVMGEADTDRRTVAMMRADAFTVFCTHVLGCEAEKTTLAGATVIVRVDAGDLQAGVGHGSIDGADQPVSIAAIRRMAASGAVIPCVLDSAGEILDFGRERRLFTRAQKLALVERDGGCAMCGLPPHMTKVHHIRWWQRDAGPTDLANGILLCETCHHRIHDNGWDIRIDNPPGTSKNSTGKNGTGKNGTGVSARARVWFIPPPSIDPTRTPRLGGRARYDIAA